jgi:deoxycytidylate deaminase
MVTQIAAAPKAKRLGPELFIGLVGAVGTDLGKVIQRLTKSLAIVGYSTSRVSQQSGYADTAPTSIRLARLLHKIPKYKNLPDAPVDVYISEHMTAGDDFRKAVQLDNALAVMAIIEIMEERKEAAEIGEIVDEIIPRRAYVLQSLKNPKELATLREVYGESFFLIAAYSQHDSRKDHLSRRIAQSRNDFPSEKHLAKAEELIQRDQEEPGLPHGQNVSGLFHRADVFVDTTDLDSLRDSISRYVELLFGNTFHTPTRDEYGMFHAQAAALRSAEPGRQVGAAVATGHGDIVTVGVNEVPKAGGGLYWCEDNPDGREFKSAQESGNDFWESNNRQIRNLVTDTLKLLKQAGWLQPGKAELSTETLVNLALSGEKPLEGVSRESLTKVFEYLKRTQWLTQEKSNLELPQLLELACNDTQPAIPKGAQIRNLIEFGRAVHAEMAALIDAARRGVSVAGCTMYVTTFPCHLCARHVVAAGIKRLVYIEPYAKSRTADLYPDSIAIEQNIPGKVKFEPFVGVAPRQYMELFTMRERMVGGRILTFDPSKASPRSSGNSRVYLENETEQTAILKNMMIKQGLYGG